MAESTLANPYATNDYDCFLSIPPGDTTSPDPSPLTTGEANDNDGVLDDLIDFDFSFDDDLYLPSIDDDHDNTLYASVDPNCYPTRPEIFSSNIFQPDHHQHNGLETASSLNAFKTTSLEFPHAGSLDNSRVLNSLSRENCDNSSGDDLVARYLNVLSPESDGSNDGSGEARVLSHQSPAASQGSGSINVVEANSNKKSVNSSPKFDINSIKTGFVGENINLGSYVVNSENNNYNNSTNSDSNESCLLKRKKGSEDSSNLKDNFESRTNKYRKSSNIDSSSGGEHGNITTEEEKKKNVRLVRNRESAQLSRQRKKHYVEELEDKVRMMHSVIQDLNAKVSYIMSENVGLRQQLSGGAVPPQMGLPHGMYPPVPMRYPWMPAPPYMVKPNGSQVPLVPIPRLKLQQPVSAPKKSKKSEGKNKKVASISFLGLLFFILLFGGLVPMVNVRYGGKREAFVGRSNLVGNGLYEKHRGRVLSVNGSGSGEKFNGNCGSRYDGGGEPNTKHGGECNGSEPLMASLYVPRNDKLVKIDGNLIIHSILASEKAMTSRDPMKKGSDETGLAVPVPGVGRNAGRHPHLALGSGHAEKENFKTTAADHRLHQWFREGLAGPMLSSGMCTEVFQFEVSASSAHGAIIPATSSRNISAEQCQNSTHINKGRNRRILPGLPIALPGSSANNVSEERARRDIQEGNVIGTDSASSMVVSVLMDPREAVDTDVDGMMGPKSLSRIFVAVLIDSVKYVTYSCMLPFKGSSGPHLVTI